MKTGGKIQAILDRAFERCEGSSATDAIRAAVQETADPSDREAAFRVAAFLSQRPKLFRVLKVLQYGGFNDAMTPEDFYRVLRMNEESAGCFFETLMSEIRSFMESRARQPA